MSKIKLIGLSGYPFKVADDYEEQTKIKHLAFGEYFDKWVKILGKNNKLNYIDGFGGPGAYLEKKTKQIYSGSPILAAEIIQKNNVNLKRNVNLIIIEEKKKNLENIKKILEYKKIDIEPIMINDEFDKTINAILKKVPNIAPTFCFIDPFGYKIKHSTLKRIMETSKSEILLNFMFNAINRWMGDSTKHRIITDLLGTEDWDFILKLKEEKRESALVNLFRKQLKGEAKIRFVFNYGMNFPTKKRTYYYLFHLSNHYKGASIMKSSFAQHAKGRVRYLGFRGNQLSFFDMSNMKSREIEDFLFDKYCDLSKSYIEIIEENIDETPFLEKEIQQAIKTLEKRNKVYIERFSKLTPERHRLRASFVENDLIHFNKFPSIERKSLLYKTKVEYGNFTINHIFGCVHGCNYPCYARMMAKRYGKIKDYEEWLHPKIVSNALKLLDKEIPKYREEIDFVHLCFSTDPFMFDDLNGRVFPPIKDLTLKIIAKLNRHDIKCTILTKGILPKELIDTEKYGKNNYYGITLVSLDEKFKKKFEPYSTSFNDRVNALKLLHDKGLKTWVSIEPYPTPNALPTSKKTGRDLDEILEKVSFVDIIIFGRMNYNIQSNGFENHKDFYEQMAKKVIAFCKKHKIHYHIKHGTQKKYDPSTEAVFSQK